ncbi:LytR/AlgR family response regulator transcription factor [Aquimarina rhabdastrellae]
MKTLIIENEPYIRASLKAYIRTLAIPIEIIGESSSVHDAIETIKIISPELILMDIDIDGGTAFDVLKAIDEVNFKVIFITAHEKYALRAIKNNAVDYILKPIDPEELEAAIYKVLSNHNTSTTPKQLDYQKDRLVLKLQNSLQFIDLNTLLYCKSDKGYTTFYLNDNRHFLASKPLKDFEKQLPKNNFIRTHQSYIINTAFVDCFDKKGFLILKNGVKIPVSTRKKDEIITVLFHS